MEPEVWQRLANCLRAQSDMLSTDSLEMIVDGLWELKELTEAAEEAGEPAPELSPAKANLFLRLSTSYNDPRILKTIGEIYLKEWGLPGVARKHFERALFLGGPEKDLRPLLEASATAAAQAASNRNEAANVPGEGAKDFLERAEEMMNKGELTQAGKLLRKANRHPTKPEKLGQVWGQLGLAYFERADFAQMEKAYRWAVHYGPKEMVYAFNLGLAQHTLGKIDLAEASYLLADRVRPGEAKVWCNLGSLYFETKRYAEAEAGLKKAIQARPGYARAWDNLAAALGAQDKLDEALVAVETALKLQPGYPEAYFKLGSILLARNSLDEAKRAFQRCLCISSLIEPTKRYLTIIESRLADDERGVSSK